MDKILTLTIIAISVTCLIAYRNIVEMQKQIDSLEEENHTLKETCKTLTTLKQEHKEITTIEYVYPVYTGPRGGIEIGQYTETTKQ